MNNLYPIPKNNRPAVILLLTLFIFLTGSLQLRAQQFFSFSQYMNNPTPINHAYSVMDGTGSLNGLYRKQWNGVDGSPTTFIFNSNIPLQQIQASAGLAVYDDKFGIEHQSEINGYFAKSIRLAENSYLAVSLNAGIRMYAANYSRLDAYDPQFKDDVRDTRPNLGFGVMYYSDNYYAGLSVPEINLRKLGDASEVTVSDFRNHFYFMGAYLTGKPGDDFRLKPSTLLSYAKGIPFIADFSTLLYIKETVGAGLNYRTNKEMAALLSLNFETVKFGYSYQFGTSDSNIGKGFNNNTNEITLSYFFGRSLRGRRLL